jgi:hypothetical protein
MNVLGRPITVAALSEVRNFIGPCNWHSGFESHLEHGRTSTIILVFALFCV